MPVKQIWVTQGRPCSKAQGFMSLPSIAELGITEKMQITRPTTAIQLLFHHRLDHPFLTQFDFAEIKAGRQIGSFQVDIQRSSRS
jgi:hypothetical protein